MTPAEHAAHIRTCDVPNHQHQQCPGCIDAAEFLNSLELVDEYRFVDGSIDRVYKWSSE